MPVRCRVRPEDTAKLAWTTNLQIAAIHENFLIDRANCLSRQSALVKFGKGYWPLCFTSSGEGETHDSSFRRNLCSDRHFYVQRLHSRATADFLPGIHERAGREPDQRVTGHGV